MRVMPCGVSVLVVVVAAVLVGVPAPRAQAGDIFCGNSHVDPGETCDDGNNQNGDCCSANCQIEENGSPCNDGDACTQTDSCVAGVCSGGNTVVCSALNQCHTVGTCNSETGLCDQPVKPEGTACNDGDACTQTDTCLAGECTGGNTVVCAASNQCHAAGICDSDTGQCSDPVRQDGTTCNDGDACTQTDSCLAGACTGGNTVVCQTTNQCHEVSTCNPETGLCDDPIKPEGTACDDGDGCTQTDTCLAGTCTGGNTVVCAALDQCHTAGSCDSETGHCDNPIKATDTACDDANACTHSDTCQNGVCTGSDPVICTASDQCHEVGVCDAATGLCDDPAKADGAVCNDANACTQTDSCVAGACAGGNPIVCSALDQCHTAGTCNITTGTCDDPVKAAGAPCNDANACTRVDSCQNGVCTGSAPAVCSASDQCHAAGTCDAATGTCSNPAQIDGATCNDGNACTADDACQAGSCHGTGGDADGDGFCDQEEAAAHCGTNDPSVIPSVNPAIEGLRSEKKSSTLLTYGVPSAARVVVATDPSCASHAICGPASRCTAGRILDVCTQDRDCELASNTCRLIVNYADVADLQVERAVLNGEHLTSFNPVVPGCARKIDLSVPPGRRAVRLRIKALGTIDGKLRRDLDAFLFRRTLTAGKTPR